MEAAKTIDRKKLDLKLASHGINQNKTSMTALLPPLEQSTRISLSTNHHNNTRSTTGIDRRIPKSVLHELHNSQQSINQTTSLLSHNEGNFFLTQYGIDPRKNKTVIRKVGSQSEIRVQKPKAKIDIIMGDLDTAISRLKNLRNPVSASKNKTRSNESSFDEKDQIDEAFLLDKNQRNMQSTGFSHKTNPNSSIYKTHNQQAEEMQSNLTEGLNKFNRVMDAIKERERKLAELLEQKHRLEEEEALVAQMKGESKDSAGALEAEIEFFESRMSELKIERMCLKTMKQTRKRDLEILQVPYLHDKSVLRDLSEFLTKESNTLAADAKEIDNIRTGLIESKNSKKKTEVHMASHMRDQIIKEKNLDNVERVIEQEIELTKFKHELQKQLRSERDKNQQEEMRDILHQQQLMHNKLNHFHVRFQEIASLVPDLATNEDIVKHIQDIQNTNVFLKEKRANTIAYMNKTRKQIELMKVELQNLRIASCNVQESDKLQVQIEESPPEQLLNEINDATTKLSKAKQEEFRLTNLENDLKKGFTALSEEFPFNPQTNNDETTTLSHQKESIFSFTVSEMSLHVQKLIQTLLTNIKNSGLTMSEINERIKEKQHMKIAKESYRSETNRIRQESKDYQDQDDENHSESDAA